MKRDKKVEKLAVKLMPCVGRWDCLINRSNPFYDHFAEIGHIDCPRMGECLQQVKMPDVIRKSILKYERKKERDYQKNIKQEEPLLNSTFFSQSCNLVKVKGYSPYAIVMDPELAIVITKEKL